MCREAVQFTQVTVEIRAEARIRADSFQVNSFIHSAISLEKPFLSFQRSGSEPYHNTE